MKVLIVSAMEMEIAPLMLVLRQAQEERTGAGSEHSTLALSLSKGEPYRSAFDGHEIDVVITGVGMVATAAWTARRLAQSPYDLALNLGLCGSFDAEFGPGTVVHITSDHLVELGAEDGENFLTVRELGLQQDGDPPFEEGRILNSAPPANAALQQMPSVEGITVNTVHGNARSIEAVIRRFQPQVESMEGAAFMYACAIAAVPYAQVRGVSNFVEPRNRAAWKIEEAIVALDRAARDILGSV